MNKTGIQIAFLLLMLLVGFATETRAQAPTTPVPLFAPADGISGQPTNLTLHWGQVSNGDVYEIEIATDEMFSSVVRGGILPTDSLMVDSLAAETTHFWHVRAGNTEGVGPWSETWRFSTSNVTLVDGGVLEFDGIVNGDDPVFVEVVGPGGVDPCGPGAGSTFGCDEVGGNNVWISSNGTDEYILGSPSTEGPAERLGLYLPNDFEVRVTEEGSYGYHPFSTGNALWVPIEVWDIGPTGPFAENDSTDDVQMIVSLFSDSATQEGECFFGYGEGELFSRPFSDRIYAYYPVEGAIYAEYEALMKPLVDAAPNGCPTDPATAGAADLIDFSRGRPIQRLVFIDNTSGAKDVADLVGTVIRLYTTPSGTSAPVPSAPEDRAVDLPFAVSLFWSASPAAETFQLQVGNGDFSDLVVDTTLAATSFTVPNFPVAGSYYWRVMTNRISGGLVESEWSAVSAFTVGTSVAIENLDAGIPTTYQLDANYPNPFNPTTTIRFGLPTSSDVRVTVYNVLGQRVTTLIDRPMRPGWYTVDWNAQGVGSGVYLFHLEAGTYRDTRTMLLLK